MNKVLKDIVVKSSLDGFDSPYIPGWDCHGLPIEHQVEKQPGKNNPSQGFPQPAASSRRSQVELQRGDFKRFGVLGDWASPYLTMDSALEATDSRAWPHHASDYLYKGAKPVHWCLDCRSALAEAEVEYEDNNSPAVDVAFAFTTSPSSRGLSAFRTHEPRSP